MLDRAKALFAKKSAAPAAEPFSLRCTCGRKVEGLRRAEAQAVACEHCGAAVFVLPVNPLPVPGPLKKSKSARAVSRSAPVAPTVDAVPDEALDVSVPSPREEGAGVRKRPAILDRKWREAEPDEEKLARRSKPWVSRRQAIVVGVLAFLILGGYGLYRRMVVRDLVENLPDRARRGFQLLQEGKLDEAYEPLRLAWRAVDWAGATYPQADAVRQAYLEVSAVKDLLPEPLDAALESTLAAPASFASRYAGRAVLLDLEVEKNPEGGWTSHWTFPVGEQVARLHPRGLTLFDDLDISSPTRVLLAARVEGVELTQDGLLLLLQPKSGVLVTEPALLEKMGLGTEVAADAIRKSQRARVLAQ